jgi:CBS domain-containing protein
MVYGSINKVMEGTITVRNSALTGAEGLSTICSLRRTDPNRMTTQSRPLQRPLVMMMCRTLRTISPDATLLEAAWLMRDEKVGALLVQEAGHYSGLISESDLVRKGMAESRPAHETLVRAVMSRPLLSIDSASSAHEASEKMAEHGIRHLAVSDEGQIVGIVSVRDLLRYFKNWGDV